MFTAFRLSLILSMIALSVIASPVEVFFLALASSVLTATTVIDQFGDGTDE